MLKGVLLGEMKDYSALWKHFKAYNILTLYFQELKKNKLSLKLAGIRIIKIKVE